MTVLHAGLIAQRRAGGWRGVLVEGPSGSGKSDLALRAIGQGFRLVADDRVVVWNAGGRLYGRAPDTLHGLMEVRGQGIAAVDALPFSRIVLVVRLEPAERTPDPATVAILGTAVPLLAVAAFEASAPAKLSHALAAFDAAHKRRI